MKITKEELREILEEYSDWLHKHHYIDSDYYTEEPIAVERYLEEVETKTKR